MPRKHPTFVVHQTKAGTFTMILEHPDKSSERWRTGIPTAEEALHRAGVVGMMCGYKVERRVRYA